MMWNDEVYVRPGVEHSPTSATGTGWERTPAAAWEALIVRDDPGPRD